MLDNCPSRTKTRALTQYIYIYNVYLRSIYLSHYISITHTVKQLCGFVWKYAIPGGLSSFSLWKQLQVASPRGSAKPHRMHTSSSGPRWCLREATLGQETALVEGWFIDELKNIASNIYGFMMIYDNLCMMVYDDAWLFVMIYVSLSPSPSEQVCLRLFFSWTVLSQGDLFMVLAFFGIEMCPVDFQNMVCQHENLFPEELQPNAFHLLLCANVRFLIRSFQSRPCL